MKFAATLLLLGFLLGCSEPPKTPEELGPWVYQKNCQRCHGANGEGTASGRNLHETTMAMTEVEKVIVTGGIGMPSFSYLTDDEREALLTYLKKEILPGASGE
jgi:mono/diheme cytochrome c family protein